MCGICGIWSYHQIDEKAGAVVQKMNEEQAHRGPDDKGIYQDKNIVLGHRRLSIIDLSKAGHQPMNYMGRYWICYNGEIYNYIELKEELVSAGYSFRTQTDTEVICAAYDYWKEACFNKLNGFWALAIYDEREECLLLSRDRYGVKPLYYYKKKNQLIFSSEIKAILTNQEIKRKLNENVVMDYLVYGLIDHTNETFFQDIYAFPPASYLKIRKNVFSGFQQFYQLKVSSDIKSELTKEQVHMFRILFQNAIQLRLRSDVKIGACLSGGLDSSAIVCAMNSMGKMDFKTFSAFFEGFRLDESEYIDEVLNYTGIKGEKVSPTGKEFWRDFDQLIYMQEQPFASASVYIGYYIMKQVQKNNIKVMLDGQGADEILCGYRKSRMYLIKQLWKHKNYKTALKEGLYSINQFSTSDNIYTDMQKLKGLVLGKKDVKIIYIRKPYAIGRYDYSSPNFIENDIKRISLPGILRIADRNSMAFSIEDRLPFLDYNLVDFSIQLPLQSKIKNGWSKYIMRCGLELPKKIRDRKTKIGFTPPEEKWMKELDKEIFALFHNENFLAGKYIDRDKIIKDWNKIISKPQEVPLFRFICLEKWMRIYHVYN